MRWKSIGFVLLGFLGAIGAVAETTLFAKAGTPHARVIQEALNTLPEGRTFIATVKLVGEFKLEKGLVLNDYTRLDLSEARLVLADGVKMPYC